MLAVPVEQIIPLWSHFSNFLHVLHTEQDYQYAVTLLDRLIDIVGEDETHPLASLMELVGLLVEKYEDTYVPEITSL
jgi:HTH-type transcriptional regulator/antitoxin HigA